jgi:hypothetical protein
MAPVLIPDGCADSGRHTSSSLHFVNITSPLQSRLEDNQKAVRSHAARQSHTRRNPLMQRIMDWSERPRELGSKAGSYSWSEYRPALHEHRPMSIAEYHAPNCAHNLLTTAALGPSRSSPHSAIFEMATVVSGASNPSSGNDSPASFSSQNTVGVTTMQTDLLISSPTNMIPNNVEASSQPQTCPFCGDQLRLFGSRDIPSTQSRNAGSPVSGIGAGRVDPFSSLPIEINSTMHFLMDHCK